MGHGTPTVMFQQLYGKKAAALYTQAGDYQKTARFYYKKAEDTYYQANNWRRTTTGAVLATSGTTSTPATGKWLAASCRCEEAQVSAKTRGGIGRVLAGRCVSENKRGIY